MLRQGSDTWHYHRIRLGGDGDAGLLEEDKYLAEVNLEEISTSSGERQYYWLLAIQTARNHYALRAQRESQQMAQSDTTGEEGR